MQSGANLTFSEAFKGSHVSAWAFIGALPLIVAISVGVEGLQHVVEFLEGLYRDRAGLRSHAYDVGRMTAGVLKVGWLLLLQFWVARFVVSGSAQAALTYDAVAIRKFSAVMVVGFAMSLVFVLLPVSISAANISGLVAALIFLFAFVTLVVPQIILIPWSVSAALGDPRASFDFASRRSEGSRLWAVLVKLLTPLPLSVLHSGLSYIAVGRAPAVTIGILALDAVVVGILGLVIAASSVMIAKRMAYLDRDMLACGPFANDAQPKVAEAGG